MLWPAARGAVWVVSWMLRTNVPFASKTWTIGVVTVQPVGVGVCLAIRTASGWPPEPAVPVRGNRHGATRVSVLSSNRRPLLGGDPREAGREVRRRPGGVGPPKALELAARGADPVQHRRHVLEVGGGVNPPRHRQAHQLERRRPRLAG